MSFTEFKGWGRLNKYLAWGLGIYLIANLVFVLYIWMQVNNRPGPGPRPGGRPPHMEHGIIEELNLNDKQQAEFKKNDAEHKKNIDSLIGAILEVKREMVKEIFKPLPDTQLVNSQIHKIGMLQEEIEKSSIRMFQELNKICTPEQKEKLLNMFKNVTRPPGPKGDMDQRFPPMPPPGG